MSIEQQGREKANNRNNSFKTRLTKGFFITVLWGISFGLYEWAVHFTESSVSEAHLFVILLFNLALFLAVWLLTGLGTYLYLIITRRFISESGVFCVYLLVSVSLLLAVKVYFSISNLYFPNNPFLSVTIVAFIFLILFTTEFLSITYLREKLTNHLVTTIRIQQWVRYLAVTMLILVSIYIVKPRIQDLLQTSGTDNDESKPNIVLLTLDTLRADHLSCYGYERKTSPFIDTIAADGVLFEECISTASWTLPSHASLFTGLYPSEHGTIYSAADKSKTSTLPDELTTLAEILKKNGYQTAGFIGGPYLASGFGMGQGFDYYNDRLGPIGKVYFNKLIFLNFILKIANNRIDLYKLSSSIEYYLIYVWNYLYGESFVKDPIGYVGWKKKANEINAVALPWIERHKNSRFFLFINYFDPHAPYALPAGYSNRYARGYKSRLCGIVSELNNMMYRRYSPTEDDLNLLISLYDSQIGYLDLHIKQLFNTLSSCGIANNTIVIITSDHGEAFGEHGLMQHGVSLYDDQIKIPLIIWGNRQSPRPRTISTQVQTIDIMPTILDIIKIPPPGNIRGKSLLPLITGKGNFERTYALSEQFEDKAVSRFGEEYRRDLKCIRTREWKYIFSSKGKYELYNLTEDKREMYNLIDSEKKISRNMEALLIETVKSFKGNFISKAKPFQVDNDLREQLRGLGYIN